MDLELLRALILIANTCFLQNSCDGSFFRSVAYFLPEIFTSMINLNANRKVNALGRIVIPSKLRDKFAIEPGDKVEFFSTYVDGVMYLCMACPHAAPPREETEN